MEIFINKHRRHIQEYFLNNNIKYNGVRLYLCGTAAVNGPIVHSPEET
jgi:hypothetical protein